MKTISDVSTEATPTDVETPSAVRNSPNTDQGWRPISVKIQPTLLAANGRNSPANAAR